MGRTIRASTGTHRSRARHVGDVHGRAGRGAGGALSRRRRLPPRLARVPAVRSSQRIVRFQCRGSAPAWRHEGTIRIASRSRVLHRARANAAHASQRSTGPLRRARRVFAGAWHGAICSNGRAARPAVRVEARRRAAICLRKVRRALDARSGRATATGAAGLPAAVPAVSGFPLDALEGVADAVGIKLYTMHWPMIARYLGADLVPGASADGSWTRRRRASPRVRLHRRSGGRARRCAIRNRTSRIRWARGAARQAGDARSGRRARARSIAFAHTYGPIDDVVDRRLVARSTGSRSGSTATVIYPTRRSPRSPARCATPGMRDLRPLSASRPRVASRVHPRRHVAPGRADHRVRRRCAFRREPHAGARGAAAPVRRGARRDPPAARHVRRPPLARAHRVGDVHSPSRSNAPWSSVWRGRARRRVGRTLSGIVRRHGEAIDTGDVTRASTRIPTSTARWSKRAAFRTCGVSWPAPASCTTASARSPYRR